MPGVFTLPGKDTGCVRALLCCGSVLCPDMSSATVLCCRRFGAFSSSGAEAFMTGRLKDVTIDDRALLHVRVRSRSARGREPCFFYAHGYTHGVS